MDAQKVYVGQTALTIRLNTFIPLENILSVQIKYIKPRQPTVIKTWNASIYDKDEGIIEYKIKSKTDLDQPGLWTCWAHITFTDGTFAPGQPAQFQVFPEGE
jgi:hypothetical protein